MKQLNFLIISLIIAIIAVTGAVSAAQQITISNVVMNADGTGTATITMDSAPTGLAGFKLALSITDTSVSDNITYVTYPSGFTLYETKGSAWSESVDYNNVDTLALGGFSDGYVKAMTFSKSTFPNSSTNVLLATVTLHGLSAGSTTLHGTLQTMTDNFGGNYVLTTTVNNGTITVNGPPTAVFTTNVTSGTAPLAVKFTDQSTGSPTTWSWDFNNDGATDSTLQNPSYTYPAAGVYTAKLTVTNTAGSNFVTHEITVTEAPVAPVAEFSASPTYLVVQFTDASTGTSPLTYAWDFNNDGSTDSTQQNPLYAYPAAGTYSVKLTVTGPGGINFVTHDVTVSAAPVPAPVVDFSGAPRTGDSPLHVQFNESSTNSPTSWAWDFQNDGVIDSTDRNASFTFIVPGTYQVRLNATNSGGTGTRLKGNYITVTGEDPNLPGTDFTSDVRTGFAPLTVHFTDNSTNSPTAWAWDFQNDGVIDSTDQNPTFIYITAGQFPVNLTATNAAGSKTRLKANWMTVNEEVVAPVALFSTNVTSGTAPLAVQFNETATGTAPLTFAWDFGDGGASTDRNPEHVYSTPGTHTAKLTVYNAAGSNFVTHDIVVAAAPVAPTAYFTSTATSGVVPLFVRFTDFSSDSPTSWLWDFGDGSTSASQNTTHTYMAAGTYTVKLTATNAVGSDNEEKTDLVTVTNAASPYADSAWPKFQVNNHNTGQSSFNGPQTNTLVWNFTTPGSNNIRGQATIGSDGTIYFGGADTSLYALYPNGTKKWSYPTINGKIANTPAIGSDGTIYFGSYGTNDKNVTALNPDGTRKWNFTTVSNIEWSSVAAANDGTLFVGDTGGRLYAINPNGTEKWRLTGAVSAIQGSPVIGQDGTIYFGSINMSVNVYAVNPDGSMKWVFNTGGQVTPALSIGPDGTIYAGSNSGKLFAINPDGSQKWNLTIGGSIYSAPAIGSDGTIYIGNSQKNMTAVNPNGTLKWKFLTGGSVDSAAAIGADGTIYFGSADKNIYAVNPDGSKRWNYTTGGGVYGSASIAPDGTLYIGSYDKNLYAFHDPITPVAEFTSDTQTGIAPLIVTFTDQSANKPTAWAWDFGDSDTTNATDQSPVHTYAAAGTYTVKLTATNAAGSDAEEKTAYISVSAPPAPVAGFSATPTFLSVVFADQSTGTGPFTYAWDFGDGATSTEKSPTHVFAATGTYTVKLTVTGPGGSDDETQSVTVGAAPVAPVAAFSATPTYLSVVFTDGSTGTAPLTYAWDFGDGATSTEQSPTHVFAAAGTYSVKLTVTGPGGSDDETQSVTVAAAPVAPVAAFTATPTFLSVAFTDTSTGTEPCTYLWDFGDSGSSTDENPTYVYAAAGTYNVKLTVTNVAGQDDEIQSVVVSAASVAPTAAFTSTPTYLSVAFTDQSTGTAPLTYAWNFGDSATSTESSPTHLYAAAGSYTVSLKVTNAAGDNTVTHEVTVVSAPVAPVAAFHSDKQSGFAPLSIAFTDDSTGSVPLTYAWDFNNDGVTDSTLQNPSFTYATAGRFTVRLTVTNSGGSNTTTKRNYVVVSAPVRPAVGFVGTPTSGTFPMTVQFNDTTTGTAPMTYAWDFNNDGITDSNEQNASYTYGSAGRYTVRLTVTNAVGSSTGTKKNYITVNPPPPPVAAFSTNVTSGKAPLAVQFTDASTGTGLLTFAWDFNNDGITDSTLRNPTYKYTAAGRYTIKLTVIDNVGSTTITKKNYISVTNR